LTNEGLFSKELKNSKPLPPPILKSKTSHRIKYEAEVAVIRSKIGNIEEVRTQLGLSRRKICQLLMVDPSAWTRWTQQENRIPPHVYRSLQWYLELIEKDPIWHPKNTFFPELHNSKSEIEDLKKSLLILRAQQKWVIALATFAIIFGSLVLFLQS